MRPLERLAVAVVFGTIAALPVVASAREDHNQQDLTDQPAVEAPTVDFGNPHDLGGGPANHLLDPKEVTISKGDFVTFRVNGPGHGIAIYPVSKNTTREHIESQLCDGTDPNCLATDGREIRDGKDRVVIVIEPGGQAVRIDSDEGRVLSAGSGAFLTGTAPPKPPAIENVPGTLVKVRFEAHGRYLVVCMNRAHVVNQAMFGFVNVTGDVNALK